MSTEPRMFWEKDDEAELRWLGCALRGSPEHVRVVFAEIGELLSLLRSTRTTIGQITGEMRRQIKRLSIYGDEP